MDAVSFANRLRAALKQKYGRIPTAKKLGNDLSKFSAGKISVSDEGVRKWVTGKSIPRGENILALSELLGVPPTYWNSK